MKTFRILAAATALLAMATTARAQLANPSAVDFTSGDHTTTIPAGQTNAGQPTLSSYQGMIFKLVDDPQAGVPVSIGPVIAKAAAVARPAAEGANRFRLTFAQMGITTPACTALPCPQYSMLIVAVGPNGTSARGVAGESDPFTAAVPVQGPPPAAPVNTKVVQ